MVLQSLANQTRMVAVAACAWLLILSASVYAADVISTWDGTTNNWTSNHWSSQNFPNNGNGGLTYDAVIGGGTVTLDQNIAIQKFHLNGGVLTATTSPTLSIHEAFDWTAGTLAGTGPTIVLPNATLAISGSGGSRVLSRVLVNNGSALWTSGNLLMNGGTFQNNDRFVVNTSLLLDNLGGTGTNTFNNFGDFTKLGTGTTRFRTIGASGTVEFNNKGIVDVQAGTLSLEGSVSQHVGNQLTGGTWRIGNGATLNFTAGSNITTNFADISLDDGSTFNRIDSLVDNRGSFAILNGRGFAPTGTFQNHGTVLIGAGSKFSASSGFIQHATGVLRGTGNLVSNLQNSGVVRPGNSPGILNIDGNFTQTPAGVLEIEVGGLTAGTQHDKVIVAGNANLNGRLDVPIINGFTPTLGNEITFLTANEVNGSFAAIFSPNLAATNPNVALSIIENPANVRLRFVQPRSDVVFEASMPTADWQSTSTWDDGNRPETPDIVMLTNLIGSPQQVNVASANAFTHRLVLEGGADTITVSIKAGLNLSAITGVTVGDRAGIELDGGSLVGSTVVVQGGGRLIGNGTVVGNLIVGGDSGAQEARLGPGFSPGHIDVEGNYEQGPNGALLVDIDGEDAGEFDTIDVSGDVELDGILRIDASNFDMPRVGMTMELITAGRVVSGSEFENVETFGGGGFYYGPIYTDESMLVGSYPVGDMNRNFVLDGGDISEFALALRNPLAYRDLRGLFGSQSGNMDGVNGLDFADIDDFADALEMANVSNALAAIQQALLGVPEPGTMTLAIVGLLGCCGFGVRRRAGQNIGK